MSNNINTTGSYQRSQLSGFYVKGIYCYDTFCTEHPLQWASTFDVANNTDMVAVITEALGDYPPGVYARVDTATTGGISRFPWRLVVPYEDFVKYCSNIQSQLRVVFAASAPETLLVDEILYRNGEKRPTAEGVLPSPFNVYGIISPIEHDFEDDAAPWKDDNAGSDNILQVSDGTGKKVKDWAPGTGGLVKTDAEGHPSIAQPGVDYSLPVDLIGVNIPTDNPAPVAGEPTVEFQVGGTTTRTMNLAQIQSGGGFKLGMLVLDHK
jgi:hypothetical protein